MNARIAATSYCMFSFIFLIWTEDSTSAIYSHVIDDKGTFFLAVNSEVQTIWVLLSMWVLRGLQTCSFDSWGSCRTPNCGSPSLCLHIFMVWLRGLASSVRGRVIVSVVRRVCRLAVHCLFTRSRSDSYQFRGSFEKIGPQLLVTRDP